MQRRLEIREAEKKQSKLKENRQRLKNAAKKTRPENRCLVMLHREQSLVAVFHCFLVVLAFLRLVDLSAVELEALRLGKKPHLQVVLLDQSF